MGSGTTGRESVCHVVQSIYAVKPHRRGNRLYNGKTIIPGVHNLSFTAHRQCPESLSLEYSESLSSSESISTSVVMTISGMCWMLHQSSPVTLWHLFFRSPEQSVISSCLREKSSLIEHGSDCNPRQPLIKSDWRLVRWWISSGKVTSLCRCSNDKKTEALPKAQPWLPMFTVT